MTAVDPADMVAGYSQAQRGRASYSGVLRNKSKTRVLWTCPDDHKRSVSAERCAAGELERRRQGQREVIVLGWCSFCRQWWTPDQAAGKRDARQDRVPGTACPRCDVPLQTVKLLVLERKPVS